MLIQIALLPLEVITIEKSFGKMYKLMLNSCVKIPQELSAPISRFVFFEIRLIDKYPTLARSILTMLMPHRLRGYKRACAFFKQIIQMPLINLSKSSESFVLSWRHPLLQVV
ncbi:hypothetical protein XarCFBP6762_15905 [Xanthomonas arboricola]|nr:hypothetical protein XarbCFBP8153_15225 [Xanthomonas arboricola]PPU24955.1 hypothetical protein XarCFBP6762_15905 [Xanthomonas arboricola]